MLLVYLRDETLEAIGVVSRDKACARKMMA